MKHRKCINLKTVFLPLFFVVFHAMAQDTTKILTLQEAIDLSIKNSKQLKLSKARIDEAIAATKEANERRLPDVSVSASYLQLSRPNVNMKNVGNDSGSVSNVNVSQALYGIANVSMPLYAGLKVKYGIESAKYLEQASILDADNDRQGEFLILLQHTSIFIRQTRQQSL